MNMLARFNKEFVSFPRDQASSLDMSPTSRVFQDLNLNVTRIDYIESMSLKLYPALKTRVGRGSRTKASVGGGSVHFPPL